MRRSGSKTAVCPECGRVVRLSQRWEVGHLLLCPHCETILAVRQVWPLLLDWAFEEPSAGESGRFPHTPIYNPHWHFEEDD